MIPCWQPFLEEFWLVLVPVFICVWVVRLVVWISGNCDKKKLCNSYWYCFLNPVNIVVIFSNAYLYHFGKRLSLLEFHVCFQLEYAKRAGWIVSAKINFHYFLQPDEVAEKVLKKKDRGFTYFHASVDLQVKKSR
ncbi:MAG: hypothetical protein Ct9H300mP21_07970 [Pseudomonadota bacterium]|nr:MAG: hypothetical protein Ct9H300mP21_07970 [Pseudomonadota bacterium]